eukprot:4346054-Prymnesium_polylepis.1
MQTPAPPQPAQRQREARADTGSPIVRPRDAAADDESDDEERSPGGTAEDGYSPFNPGRGREVDNRLLGRTKANPSNRGPPNLRPRPGAASPSAVGALLAGGTFLLAKAG